MLPNICQFCVIYAWFAVLKKNQAILYEKSIEPGARERSPPALLIPAEYGTVIYGFLEVLKGRDYFS
jgi:hypothetical protein